MVIPAFLGTSAVSSTPRFTHFESTEDVELQYSSSYVISCCIYDVYKITELTTAYNSD